MQRTPITGQRLVAVFFAGLLLLNFPLVSLVSGGGSVLGIPATVAYLFFCWAALIAAMAWIIEGRGDSR
jgi:hypothetical protein